MGILELKDGHLEYALHTAAGEPLLMLHGSPMAAMMGPLIHAPELQERYQIISYRRQGHEGSPCPNTPIAMHQLVADGMALLEALNIPRVHLLGYSFGAGIAMQWALEDAQSVHSLSLLEPPLMNWVPTGRTYFEAMASLQSLYFQGEREQARALMFQGALGPDYMSILGAHDLDGCAFESVLTDLEVLFKTELPAVKSWSLDELAFKNVKAPVLIAQGLETAPFWAEGQGLLKRLLPAATELLIPHAGHAMPLQNPKQLARGIAEFLASHPF